MNNFEKRQFFDQGSQEWWVALLSLPFLSSSLLIIPKFPARIAFLQVTLAVLLQQSGLSSIPLNVEWVSRACPIYISLQALVPALRQGTRSSEMRDRPFLCEVAVGRDIFVPEHYQHSLTPLIWLDLYGVGGWTWDSPPNSRANYATPGLLPHLHIDS